MVMTLGETCWNNEGGCHLVVSQTDIEFVYKNSIFRTTSASSGVYIEFLYRKILSQFVKPPSDTLLRYW
jgi:hypothetical protein